MPTLTGELSFATAEELLARTRAGLGEAQGAVELDLAGVTRTDSAGLALLLELTREARAASRELRFTHAPAQLRSLAAFFGVAELLNLAA
jgi:phospholipid transport system transporter-binding protein